MKTLMLFAAAGLFASPLLAQAGGGMAAADTNKDGALSAAEWEAAGRKPEGFQRIDTNKDGKLTQAELMAARNGAQPGKFFDATDTDRDGAISKAEWDASGRNPQGFQMMDSNKDGKVTRAEADAAMATMMQRRGQPN
jgi:Ca2+-binding EF-hand superfamily protein